MRVLAVAGLAAVSFTCADRNISGLGSKLAFLPIAPAWIQAPDGGPDIEIERVRGVLRTSSGLDSAVAEATVAGDSAVLEFLRVSVSGDSTSYGLSIQAFDSNDVVVFSANDTISVHPGENPPATPEMQYTAPDAVATQVEIQIAGTSAAATTLDWLGAKPGDLTCLHRIPDATKVTTRQLTAIGRRADNTPVPDIRVGWTSLNEAVATVDDNGVLRSRCSNLSTKVIARSFLDRADTITVNVVAPPFTLLMSPETISLPRGSSQTLSAVVIDENGNQSPATGLTWTTSDPSKATVNSSGVVTAVRNGRVQITATSGDRTTVGIVDVIRPQAASVKVLPVKDTLAFGQVRQFVARALDAAGNVIGDAVDFAWTSSATDLATVGATTGLVTAKNTPTNTDVTLTAAIDGKQGTGALRVVSNLPPGTIAGVVRNAQTDAPIAGAQVGIVGGTPAVTDANGRFSLGGVAAGDDLSVTATGMAPITFFDAPAFPSQTIVIDEIPMPPAGGTGGITGKVINPITATGVSGVTVSLFADLNSQPSPIRSATPIATTTTNASGVYSFTGRNAGAYTLTAGGTGYATGIAFGVVIGGQNARPVGDIVLPPSVNNAGLYVVLTWGAGGTNMPADLDLHMTGPLSATDTNRFQIHSGNRVRTVGIDTIATIDIADATGPGPEVASLRAEATPGLYRFYVKNISHIAEPTRKSLADSSDVRVDVFQGNRVIATFLPPAGQGGVIWEVFRFDGARVLPVGAMVPAGTPNTLPLRIPETPVTPSSKAAIPIKRR